MRTITDGHPAMTFLAALLPFLFLITLGGEMAAAKGGWQEAGDEVSNAFDQDSLKGRRFRFSWSSTDGTRGFNGVALLRENGRIEGIGSPNETFWLVDDAGRLLFKHADGRISTRYEKARLVEGLRWFEGPFLFREGITHHLIEIESGSSDHEHRIIPEQMEKIKYSTQRVVYLDPGESCTFKLRNGREKEIKLVSVVDHEDSVIHLKRRAEVKVEIDGEIHELDCAPYVMPEETDGLRIQADTTTGWLSMPKRVQLSLWDASDPIVDTSRFGFPLPGYRLFSHGMQAYNEPVHLGHEDGDPGGQRFYHNYGVDLAGYEFRQKVLSCIDGVVVGVDRREGDLSIRDDRGFVLYFGHLDSILSEIRLGSRVRKGQWVAMLGKRGGSGNFSHLHVGAYLSELAMTVGRMSLNLNLYPWLVAAYQAESDTDLYAVARPHKAALTGEKVRFDGSHSMARDSEIISCEWVFHDGTSADGPVAEKVYEEPGCYMAALWLKNGRGERDVDFCRVRIYSRSAPEDVIGTLFVTYMPSRDVRVDQPLYFRIWPQGLGAEDIQVDFGDGALIRDYRPYSAVTHTFRTPGIHVVTVTATAAGLPVIQQVKVVVGD